ncbi:23S rRNA m(1)G-748 methyltransferase [Friedmanniella luteola]|uniref:23S rRNA m(1)G-748 methyltransferase n=1 Tax=Friedmanniella luteola TaxID=546871 RepID=A0A1H1PPQ2_9ACTN|nr:methyltransferase domain-containing protein [Friedmanniella luteola]SDS13037.1 23S rRNA m(1)G-748 methyltransferase [Friedmanniella luteola]
MSVAEVLDLLRCPVCRQPFTLDGGGVRCAAGHRFDLARQGYLNLLGARPPQHADSPAMVAARERFLGGGAYAPVAAALVDAAASALTSVRAQRPGAPTLLEVGAGTGYYTDALLTGLGGRAVAVDISAAAARRAARTHPQLGVVVADAWADLPLADSALDVVTSVFAPRNAAEFARVLRPDGVLVVVTPRPDHLQEVRQALGLLEVAPAKQARLAARLADHFTAAVEVDVRFEAAWERPVVLDLVAMGPNAFHVDAGELASRVEDLPDPVRTTVAVAVSTWVRRPG